MATVTNALTFSRRQAQTDNNGLTDALGLEFANSALVDYRRRLQAAGIDASSLQEAHTDMSADIGTYLYPADMFWLKAIQLNYTSAVAQDYITANQVDVSNLPNMTSFGWLRTNASTASPYFNDMGDWFEIFPTPDSANSQGIRIWYFQEATEYTSVNNTIAYPESLDYHLLGWKIASSYYKSLNKFDEAALFELEYEKIVKDVIATLGRGTQQPITAQEVVWSGWEF